MKINQKERESRLVLNTKKNWKTVNIDINPEIGKKMVAFFARDQIKNYSEAAKCKVLKYFANDCHKWNILNLVMYYGAKGDAFYKNKQNSILKISNRKFDKIIKDCIEQNLFIYAQPLNAKIVSKIKNIRPSEKLLIAWSKYNIKRLKIKLINIKKFNIK